MCAAREALRCPLGPPAEKSRLSFGIKNNKQTKGRLWDMKMRGRGRAGTVWEPAGCGVHHVRGACFRAPVPPPRSAPPQWQGAGVVTSAGPGRRAPGRVIPGLAPSPRLKEDAVTGIGHTLA